MVCTTSKSIKLFRAIYVKATGNYGTEPEDSAIAALFASAKDLKVTSGPSEISIESQEVTLENYGKNLRNDHSQFAYFKVTGGNIITPHHSAMITDHSSLFKSGFGALTEGAGSTTTTAALTDTDTVALTAVTGLEVGMMIKIGGDTVRTITSIDALNVSFSPEISTDVTYPTGTTVAGLDTWDPQCLEDNDYYHFLIWDADEYWLIPWLKPSFAIQGDDGGVPRQWQMNISAYSARRITDSLSAIATLFDSISEDTLSIATLNQKVNIAINDIIKSDIVSLTLNIERENTRWETGVNAKGAVGSINDVTNVGGELTVFTNKTDYHTLLTANTETSISFESHDANFAFYAPKAKLTKSGQNPINENSGQNVAMFGVSYNEDHSENIAMYLGDI